MWFFGKRKPAPDETQELSPAQYEEMAERYLRERGYKIAERNYRLRSGEIDIVAQIEHEIVFVEVRKRANEDFGSPEETVNAAKQERLHRAAQVYLNNRYMSQNFVARFDVIAITHEDGDIPKIRHFPNAF